MLEPDSVELVIDSMLVLASKQVDNLALCCHGAAASLCASALHKLHFQAELELEVDHPKFIIYFVVVVDPSIDQDGVAWQGCGAMVLSPAYLRYSL